MIYKSFLINARFLEGNTPIHIRWIKAPKLKPNENWSNYVNNMEKLWVKIVIFLNGLYIQISVMFHTWMQLFHAWFINLRSLMESQKLFTQKTKFSSISFFSSFLMGHLLCNVFRILWCSKFVCVSGQVN